MAPIVCEKILLATGRRPAVDHLGLKAAGVELDAKGRLEVDDDMRVKGKANIFAAGDVAGLRMVVHHAHIEAGIAAENACSDGRPPMDEALQHRSHLFRSGICLRRMHSSRCGE